MLIVWASLRVSQGRPDAAGEASKRAVPIGSCQSTLAPARRRHAGGFSLKQAKVMKADGKVGLTGRNG
jgi:hypothetical protein